jgi:hypothetical protein
VERILEVVFIDPQRASPVSVLPVSAFCKLLHGIRKVILELICDLAPLQILVGGHFFWGSL